MRKRTLYIVITAVAISILIVLIKNMLSQPSTDDMQAGFKEIAKYRNENNTGPVQRIYVVTVKDTIWSEIQEYGNYMPHTKYGNTKVYFFMEGTDVPEYLEPGSVNFDPIYNKQCIARYEKSAMSQSGFVKYPFAD